MYAIAKTTTQDKISIETLVKDSSGEPMLFATQTAASSSAAVFAANDTSATYRPRRHDNSL
jgi:hypothetical protein